MTQQSFLTYRNKRRSNFASSVEKGGRKAGELLQCQPTFGMQIANTFAKKRSREELGR
jgi:hypothetical protein